MMAAVAVLACEPARGYNPPDGPDNYTADLGALRAHGTVIAKALDVLEGDGFQPTADYYRPYLQQLANGVRQADYSNGSITISGINITSVSVNSFAHFYNPITGKGLVMDSSLLSVGGWLDWQVHTLKGPHPGANDMADWAYAQAVLADRDGDTAAAMTYLGWALHYLGDMSVPQHVTDQDGLKSGSQHVEYEDAVDGFLVSIPHAHQGGEYDDSRTAGQTMEQVAGISRDWLWSAQNDFQAAANVCVPLAERYSAGLLRKFHNTRLSEGLRHINLTIDRVKAVDYGFWDNLTKKLDYGVGGQADFYTRVRVDGKYFDLEPGYVQGCDDMRPNSSLPWAWFFPRRVTGSDDVPFNIEIWDDDNVVTGGDDHAYISLRSGVQDLDFTYNVRTGALGGPDSGYLQNLGTDASGAHFYSRGNHSSGDEAEIWFTIKAYVANPVPKSISDAKRLSNGTIVDLNGKVVSAVLPNCIYVRELSGVSGIRVSPTTTVSVGDVVKVTGALSVVNECEAALTNATVQTTSHLDRVSPVGMPLSRLGGSPNGIQNSVGSGIGLNNVGLLIRAWGQVTGIESVTPPALPTWLTIDDGSGASVKCVCPGGFVGYSQGRHVGVTGISSCEKVGSDIRPVILLRGAGDAIAY